MTLDGGVGVGRDPVHRRDEPAGDSAVRSDEQRRAGTADGSNESAAHAPVVEKRRG